MKNGKKVMGLLLAVMLCFAAGCGKQEQVESGQEWCVQNTSFYSIPDLQSMADYIGYDEGYIYYYQTNFDEEEGCDSTVEVYRQSITGGQPSEKLEITVAEPIIRCASVLKEGTNKTKVVFVASYTAEPCEDVTLHVFSVNGEETNTIDITEENLLKDNPTEVISAGDGRFALLNEKTLTIVNAGGEVVSCQQCPGDEFTSIVSVNERYCGIQYSQKGTNKIVVYDTQDDKFGNSFEVPVSSISVKSYDDAGEIKYTEEKKVKCYDVTTGNTTVLFDFSQCNYETQSLYDVVYSNDKYVLIGLSATNYSEFKICELIGPSNDIYDVSTSTSGESTAVPTPAGPKTIKVMICNNDAALSDEFLVDAFNEHNTEYQAVLANTDIEGDFDVAKLISDNELPDVLITDDYELTYSLYENGYLENIATYFENDNDLSLEDLSAHIVDEYSQAGFLLALPRRYYFELLAVSEAERIDKRGWTWQEFIAYLNENPEQMGNCTSKKAVYDVCIDGVLAEYIDYDTDTAHFADGGFAEFLKSIDELNMSAEAEEITDSSFYDDYSKASVTISESRVGEPAAITNYNNYSTKAVSLIGYPSCDSNPRVNLIASAVSILNAGNEKEGAFEFLKFWLTYVQSNQEFFWKQGMSQLYTVNSLLEQNIKCLYESEIGVDDDRLPFTEEDVNAVMDFLPFAHLQGPSKNNIRSAIDEEVDSFLLGGKAVDEVCGVIQSRVQLILDER